MSGAGMCTLLQGEVSSAQVESTLNLAPRRTWFFLLVCTLSIDHDESRMVLSAELLALVYLALIYL